MQAVGLHRVIRRQIEQGLEGDRDSRLRRFVGFEELLIAREQEAAHPGFQIDGQFYRFIGVIDHPVGVLDPLDHRQQISDQRNEEHGTEYADTQRQTRRCGSGVYEIVARQPKTRRSWGSLVDLLKTTEFAPKPPR